MGKNNYAGEEMIFKYNSDRVFDHLIILLQLIVLMNPILEDSSYIYIPTICLVLIRTIGIFLKEKCISNFELWMIVFLSVLFITGLIGINASKSMGLIKAVIFRFCFLIIIYYYVKRFYDIKKILILFIYSILAMSIYIVFNVSISSLFDSKLGSDLLGMAWNANFIGINMALGTITAIFVGLQSKKLYIKYYYYILALFFAFLAISTQSKTALIVIVLSMLLYNFFILEKTKIVPFIKYIIIFLLLMLLVYNIPIVKEVILVRFDSLFFTIFENDLEDKSGAMRLIMIQLGIDWFMQKPLLGYGLGNFSTLFADTIFNVYGPEGTYSHNNYIELAVGCGLTGFFTYYGYLIWIMRGLLSKIYSEKNVYAAFLLATTISLLISDVSRVSYHTIGNLIFICLSSRVVFTKLSYY